MLWIILVCLIVIGVITNNFTPLKVFGKVVAWFFAILLLLSVAAIFIVPLVFGMLADRADERNRKDREAYWEKVKQTPLVQWACDSDGYQLYMGERPLYVYQCSTGKLVAEKSGQYYTCEDYKQVNHWKHCGHSAPKSSKYDYLRN